MDLWNVLLNQTSLWEKQFVMGCFRNSPKKFFKNSSRVIFGNSSITSSKNFSKDLFRKPSGNLICNSSMETSTILREIHAWTLLNVACRISPEILPKNQIFRRFCQKLIQKFLFETHPWIFSRHFLVFF